MNATNQKTLTLREFLSEHEICRVWHTGFDAPAGDEHVLNVGDENKEVADEDYCDSEALFSILTDWLSLNLDSVEGEVTKDADGEYRWELIGGDDLRNCRGNSIYRITVWGE